MYTREVPFYSQAAILDRYIHSDSPRTDIDSLEVILEILAETRYLRDYFFRSGPSPAWAPILWEKGFFDKPPTPQEGSYVLPGWDVQEYLISIASQAPDVVLNHIASLNDKGFYHARALCALCALSVERINEAIPTVLRWLNEPTIALAIAREAFDLFKIMVEGEQTNQAFNVFASLTAPLPPSAIPSPRGARRMRLFGIPATPTTSQSAQKPDEIPTRENAISKFEWLGEYKEEQMLREGTESLLHLDPPKTVALLENHLCQALAIEAAERDIPDYAFSSWWRSAIKDTNQDNVLDYKERLLVVLRDALTIWAKQDGDAVEPLVRRYLGDQHQILRRLGLYLLFAFPEQYREFLIQELGKPENLDDIRIRHEFFILLAREYPVLPQDDKIRLVKSILQGPPPDTIADFSRWAEQWRVDNPDKYIETQRHHWIGVRLWMIRDYLEGEPAEKLAAYVEEHGEPEHPTFSSWHSEAYMVRDVSPAAAQDLKRMTPEELRAYVESFEPPPERSHGPERTSHCGLAEQVARVILEIPGNYQDHLFPIARRRPEYAIAILEKLAKIEPFPPGHWEIGLRLCEALVEDDVVRTSMERQPDGNWRWVCSRVVEFLESGFKRDDRLMPPAFWPRARDLLLTLLDDPDPDQQRDRPPEGYAGHQDPMTVAINTVRPKALSALLDYARFRANRLAEMGEIAPAERLEAVVREALARKLDHDEDPSWAVHSVFGLYLTLLYWLDSEWFESNLDRIFPEEDDEDTVRFFVAAWDAFVTYNAFPVYLFDLLRNKYKHAIENASKGFVTQDINRPVKHLAVHLVLEYWLADYEPAFEDGQPELLGDFFNTCSPDARSDATWSLWRALERHSSELDRFWPRARALWAWRVREASQADHSTDFDEEMGWLARLPMLAPESETMTTLWPLLEGLLPHVSRPSDRNMGWEEMELYLAREVERDPVKAIQFYLLMHRQGKRPTWHLRTEEARKIVEAAAAQEAARHDALELIDLLARSGVYDYRDIYERYAG